jgi:hypothetical protein
MYFKKSLKYEQINSLRSKHYVQHAMGVNLWYILYSKLDLLILLDLVELGVERART